MIDLGVAVSWMVLSPLAFITDVIAVVIIAHYFPFFHGTDVTLVSIMVAMAGNAIFVLPIPAFLELTGRSWNLSLCIGYVWCVLTFRLAQLLSLMVISIHWSTLLKMSAQKKKYFSTKFLKITIVFIWICSATFGLLPLIGVADESFNKKNRCKFLAFNIGSGYGLVFLILIFTAMFVSILCALDAMILIKHMKTVAKTKYQAGRFHIPDKRTDLPPHGNTSLAERYHRLQFAWDLSRFALVFVTLSFAINHLPYAIIQAVQTFTSVDREVLEIVSLYLVVFDALLVPHTLWLLSRRYRHALKYQWQVHILRNKENEEEEPYSCTLQSYTQREKDRASLAASRPSSLGRAAGITTTGTVRSTKSEIVSSNHRVNGHTHIQTVFPEQDGRLSAPPRLPRVNGVMKGEVYVERTPSLYDERPVDIHVHTLDTRHKQEIPNTMRTRKFIEDTGTPLTNLKYSASLSQRSDVTRSSSGRSRRDWNEHVRKKHLPPIFVNQGYVVSDNSPTVEDQTIKIISRPGPHSGRMPHHFYMSSDYHPDCLTESLPRNKLKPGMSTESDSGMPYTNDDIDEVLDDDSITDMQIVKARTAHVYNKENGSNMYTYNNDTNEIKSNDSSGKGIYGTFEDLSQMYLRDEEEIEVEEDSIHMDDLNSAQNINTQLTSNTNTTNYGAKYFNYSSFKPSENTINRINKSEEYQLPNRQMKRDPFAEIAEMRRMKSTSFTTHPNDRSETAEWYSETIPGDAENFKDSQDSLEQSTPRDFSMPVLNLSRPYDYEKRYRINISNSDTDKSFSESTGFSVSSINDIQEPKQTDAKHVGNKQDTSIDDENASSGSNSSVTLSPYKGEPRKRPWMDDFDIQNEENAEVREPLVQDSDTDTLRDSHESSELRFGVSFDPRYISATHSGLSTPVSSIFDEETDRGFEDALEQHISPGSNVYGGVGLCFESIKEEPEDLTSSGSNPFLENISNGDDEFRTQAVISRNSGSRTSSSGSVSDNPFSSSPAKTSQDSRRPSEIKYKAPFIITTDADAEFGDSGFTSGLDRGNMSDSSSHQEFTPRGRNSPWPDEENVISQNLDLSFETDFCAKNDDFNSALGASAFPNTEAGIIRSGVSTFKREEVKKPVHKALENVRSKTRPQPMRVKSLERTSPSSARKLPKRGHSFEAPRTDVKPAYF